jgi:Tol biopolymer transport system component
MSYGYLWPLNKDMNIYVQDTVNKTIEPLITKPDSYTAEAVISADGTRIIYTSDHEGDLELYTANIDGTNQRRMTYTPGYDGGAWFSWDNKLITWRANRPRGQEYADYKNLLDFGLVSPVNMQIYYQVADLSQPAVQVTNNTGTNFAPVFTPDSKGLVFSSDLHAPNRGNFQLYYVNLDGSGLRQITT